MNLKLNQILLGIIFILLGVFALTQNFIRFNYIALTLTGVGCAMLLLYKTKRKSWSLIVGVYLLFIGILSFMASQFGSILAMMPVIIAGMLFLVPGFIFLTLFYEKHKNGLLIPASLLIWLGLYIIAFCVPGFPCVSVCMFFVFVGLAFIMMYLLGNHFLGRLFLYLGVSLILFGFITSFGFFHGFAAFRWILRLMPGAVILVGLVIIIKALLSKK